MKKNVALTALILSCLMYANAEKTKVYSETFFGNDESIIAYENCILDCINDIALYRNDSYIGVQKYSVSENSFLMGTVEINHVTEKEFNYWLIELKDEGMNAVKTCRIYDRPHEKDKNLRLDESFEYVKKNGVWYEVEE